MQQNAQTANTNRLVAVVQNSANAEVRARALQELWEIHGARLVGIMAKKSYWIDSDFSLRGCTLGERRGDQSGKAYIVFHNAVMSFDLGAGVPFGAYIAQKGNWCVEDEKRENSRRGNYEEVVDFSTEDYASEEVGPDDAEPWKLAIRRIYQATEQNPRLHRYVGIWMDLLREEREYSDAEVARRMGCTRANVGLYKKAVIRMMQEDSRFVDICPRPAA